MKLPNPERAVIDPRKIRDYLLSPVHPIGRYKARFFATLGYKVEEWEVLERDIRREHLKLEAKPDKAVPGGQTFRIRGTLHGPNGRSAMTVSVWIVRSGQDVARFVTLFPGD